MIDQKFILFQIDLLHENLSWSKPFSQRSFFYRHSVQFYWTLTRLMGLEFLHRQGTAKNSMPGFQGVQNRPVQTSVPSLDETKPRLLIDLTHTSLSQFDAGINRVCRALAEASLSYTNIVPIVIDGGKLIPYFQHPALPAHIEMRPADKLFLFDVGWEFLNEYEYILKKAAASGTKVVFGIHDLIPIMYPGVTGRETRLKFCAWLDLGLEYADSFICISKTEMDRLVAYVEEVSPKRKAPRQFGWFHLGSDFRHGDSAPSSNIETILKTSYFLTVGTLEGRKNHAAILRAFDRLRQKNIDLSIVMVGKYGWFIEPFISALTSHKEFGKRLIWLKDCSDGDLVHLYKNAKCLIQASIAEGFGLPVVEAARFGVPVIASDIGVFREIGKDAFLYFDPLNSDDLAEKIQAVVENRFQTKPVAVLSWAEASSKLFGIISSDNYPVLI